MQYALLIYQGTTPLPNTDAWEALPPAEQQRIYADYAAINKNPAVSPGLPLGLPAQAKTVRVENGKAVTSDGPFMGAGWSDRRLPRARSRRRGGGDRARLQRSRRHATAARSRCGRSRSTGDTSELATELCERSRAIARDRSRTRVRTTTSGLGRCNP